MADYQVYEIIHTSPELVTVYDFISDNNSPAFSYVSDPESFLNVKNTKGQTNREVIESTYTTQAERDAYVGKGVNVMLLKVGTRLAIEQKKVNKAGLMTEGLEIVSYDIPAFKARALAELESNEGYTVQDYQKPIKGKFEKGSFRQIYPDLTVWVWCRALASAENNFEGEIFNLTPFIQKVSTDVGKNGGNFNVTLPPLICEINDKGKWVIKKKSIQFYSKHRSLQKQDYIADDSLYSVEDGELSRNQFLFHSIISPNDLVWIRFETLKIEQETRVADSDQLFVSKYNIPGKIYDMIGLVDVDGISISPANTDVSIQLTGRDLSKLFIEDGTYVFNLELSQGMLGGPGSSQASGLSRRLIADRSLLYLGLYFNNTIEKVIKFVINQLSNIKVVPDELFLPYGDRRNTRFEEQSATDASKQISKQKEAYRREAKEAIAALRESNALKVASPQEEQGKINQIYSELYRFLQTIREQKVRITSNGVTEGWRAFSYLNERGVNEAIEESVYPQFFSTDLFNLHISRYVGEATAIVTPIDRLLDLNASESDYKDRLIKEPAPGIWQIIKLVLDKGVTNRRIIDSSLSSANGSLINYFRKICQEPFVEYFMDTYGDMYHLIVRKPPTDKAGILSMLRSQVTTETEEGERVTPAIIDIEADDVIVEQLSFDDSEVVSWYHLLPQANFQGSDQFSLAYLPAIFLPEYADIWGSRPMSIVHNYLPTVLHDADRNSLDIVQKQAIEDLRFLIQSTAYLPFTRKGVLKLNPDRRLKLGNLIRYKPTGEIFHVDHVKQEFEISEQSIDRTTTVQVSRGMIEQLIYGVPAKSSSGEAINGYISYFNIVDTTPVYEYKDTTSYVEERIKIGERKVEGTVAAPEVNYEYPLSTISGKGNQNIYELQQFGDKERNLFTKFIYEINRLGYKVIITSGVRSYVEQQALHARDNRNAKPGHSRHERKKAIDINLIHRATNQTYGLRVGKTSVSDWLSTGVPQLARSLGIGWGGQDFGSYHDVVHFQILGRDTPAKSETIEDVYETRKKPVKQTSLDIGKIFSNVKVNKHVFDFFMRREQFKYKKVNDKGVYEDDGTKVLSEIIIKSKKKGGLK